MTEPPLQTPVLVMEESDPDLPGEESSGNRKMATF